MIYYDGINVCEGIGFNKTSALKECVLVTIAIS